MLANPITRGFLLAAFAVALVTGAGRAEAQSCTNDFQCGPSAAGYSACLGDTLITRRRLCVGGQCLEQETGRMDCGGGIGGTCQGNTFVRSGNRCDALSGRCVQGSGLAIACVASCTCTGRTLTLSTGTCAAGGCVRTVVVCKSSCTCAPEPRCTEDRRPLSSRSGAVAPTTPAARASAEAGRASRIEAEGLPPLIAVPFEAGAVPRARAAQRAVRSLERAKRAN